MRQTTKRRRRTQPNTNITMLVLIGVLAVLLGIAIWVAVAVSSPDDSLDATGATGESTLDTSVQESTSGDAVTPMALTVTYPAAPDTITMVETVELSGTADPKKPLTVNGQSVQVAENGSFRYPFTLSLGDNEIVFVSGEETLRYRVHYRYAVQSYSPVADMQYFSGGTVRVDVIARQGSQLKVTLGSKEIAMKEVSDQTGMVPEGFARFEGTYQLPDNNTSDLNLGKIQYTVTCDGKTETYSSGEITCQKSTEILASNPAVTPSYGEYKDVGSGYICEIIAYSAETFNGKTNDSKSEPIRNYLPKGTVDYASVNKVTNGDSAFYLLRCGRRVFEKKSNYPGGKVQVVDVYKGKLPDHNEIAVASLTQSGHHTILTFDTMWKAPFYFDLLPQKYYNAATRDYRVKELTAEYVDITFCYATVFEGTVNIPENHPLFKSAELIKRESDCTLRLYLKKTGGFYGWDSYYNENNQLCFQFLNPTPATATDNAYGADLTGIRVLIDVGHGGIDPGTVHRYNGKQYHESDFNMIMAQKLKKELESVGATVILNREDEKTLKADDRIQQYKATAADLCVAIHQNSVDDAPYYNGAEILYATPFSALVSQLVAKETEETGIYSKTELKWHYYYVARQSTCPVVLTENGFMSNETDLLNMLDDAVMTRKVQAIARGVVKYFLSIA